MPLSRRHFLLGSTGAVLMTARPRTAWPLQTAGGSAPPLWRPNADLLRNLPRLLELASVPGLALGIIEGKRLWRRGFGDAVEESAQPVSNETIFEAASLGKPVFAYAILRLVDAGVIDLDRPLYDYLPLPETDNPRMRRVTARHVLSHSTGLPNWRHQPSPLEPSSDPGSRFSYSGEGYFYLQRVAEKLTDKGFGRLMREQVLDPLGMTQSSYVWRPDFGSRMAAGYDAQEKRLDVQGAIGPSTEMIAQDWGKPLDEWRYEDAARAVQLVNPAWPVLPLYIVPNAAASLLTSVSDYARFLTGIIAPVDGAISLSTDSRKQMLSPQVRLNSALQWGLGWGIQRDEYGEVLWQWGANNSFRNFVIADAINGRAIVVFTNSENGPRIYERVIVAVTGHDHPAFLWI
jgi:CubicO group peptidase (beta-lactamase class C family)